MEKSQTIFLVKLWNIKNLRKRNKTEENKKLFEIKSINIFWNFL